MENTMNTRDRQVLDDVFDAFTMLSGGSIVSVMHVKGNVTRWSPAGVELFGLSGEYIANGSMDWGDFVHPEDRKRYADIMSPLIEGGQQTYDITYRVRTKNGEYGIFRAMGAVLRDSKGDASLIGGVLINQGLTENVDPITVLPNQNAYFEDLTEKMEQGKRTFSLKVGISKLSDINRVHGYTYGNRIMQEVAWLIQEIVKDRGTLYRMKGAAFVVLFEKLSREEVAAVYDMIRYQLQRGIQVGGIKNILLANGGLISAYHVQADASTVYSCLNYAYEESRSHMHGELVDFNGSVNYEGTKSLEMINEIRECVLHDCKGFQVMYDPVIDFCTEKINGAEEVICWQDEKYGIVQSKDFMPILERDFVYEELGDFILEKSLSDGVKVLEKNPDFLLCINIHRIQLESDYFIDNLLYFLKETGFPGNRLSLKLAGDCRNLESKRMKKYIQLLHDNDIIVIIDKFGSGTDSIVFLKNVPVDAVCLDEQFTHGIVKSSRDRDIADCLTKMAATCVEHVNIKGVQSKELRDALYGMSITTMQGSYYSEPISFHELLKRYYC